MPATAGRKGRLVVIGIAVLAFVSGTVVGGLVTTAVASRAVQVAVRAATETVLSATSRQRAGLAPLVAPPVILGHLVLEGWTRPRFARRVLVSPAGVNVVKMFHEFSHVELAHEVARWYAHAGAAGLERLFTKVRDGEAFQQVFQMLLLSVVCQKHEGFREEREWRAIYCPTLHPSELMEGSVEVVAGVPQPVYRLPLDGRAAPVLADLDFARVFDRLIIGPTPYSWAIYEAFAGALAEAGVEEPKKRVVVSGIPIRG